MFKKLLIITLAISSLLTLSACQKEKTEEVKINKTEEIQTEIKITKEKEKSEEFSIENKENINNNLQEIKNKLYKDESNETETNIEKEIKNEFISFTNVENKFYNIKDKQLFKSIENPELSNSGEKCLALETEDMYYYVTYVYDIDNNDTLKVLNAYIEITSKDYETSAMSSFENLKIEAINPIGIGIIDIDKNDNFVEYCVFDQKENNNIEITLLRNIDNSIEKLGKIISSENNLNYNFAIDENGKIITSNDHIISKDDKISGYYTINSEKLEYIKLN